MTDDLEERLRRGLTSEAAGIAPLPSDLHQTREHGLQRRRTRLLTIAAVALVVFGGVAGAGLLSGRDTARSESADANPTPVIDSTETTDDGTAEVDSTKIDHVGQSVVTTTRKNPKPVLSANSLADPTPSGSITIKATPTVAAPGEPIMLIGTAPNTCVDVDLEILTGESGIAWSAETTTPVSLGGYRATMDAPTVAGEEPIRFTVRATCGSAVRFDATITLEVQPTDVIAPATTTALG